MEEFRLDRIFHNNFWQNIKIFSKQNSKPLFFYLIRKFINILQAGNWKQDFTIQELKNVPVRHHSKAKNPTQAGAGANNDHDSAPVFQGIYKV